MDCKNRSLDAKIEEYWSWISIALFLLLTVDALTTFFAARVVGVQAEANPLMRWALEEGTVVFTAVNLIALLLAVGIFYGLIKTLRNTSPPTRKYFVFAIEVWLGFLVASGLFIVANNLSVIIVQKSLFAELLYYIGLIF